jgi:hypothetical protein
MKGLGGKLQRVGSIYILLIAERTLLSQLMHAIYTSSIFRVTISWLFGSRPKMKDPRHQGWQLRKEET